MMGLRLPGLSAFLPLLLVLLLSVCDAKLTVHLNCHTHDDVGWLKTVDQYYVGLNKTIDSSVVQYILETTITALEANPQRKFMYVEQAFFQRFWQQQTDERKAAIRRLVSSRQLEFVNGGWCMHDEATTHYIDMVDQTTLGHRFIVSEFGAEANPTIGWQIDPFGHSATQASLLSSQAGFQAFFTARIDHADFRQRYATNATEWIWQASPSLPGATVFGGIFQWADRQLYGPPSIFNYELYSNSPPIQNDPRLTVRTQHIHLTQQTTYTRITDRLRHPSKPQHTNLRCQSTPLSVSRALLATHPLYLSRSACPHTAADPPFPPPFSAAGLQHEGDSGHLRGHRL